MFIRPSVLDAASRRIRLMVRRAGGRITASEAASAAAGVAGRALTRTEMTAVLHGADAFRQRAGGRETVCQLASGLRRGRGTFLNCAGREWNEDVDLVLYADGSWKDGEGGGGGVVLRTGGRALLWSRVLPEAEDPLGAEARTFDGALSLALMHADEGSRVLFVLDNYRVYEIFTCGIDHPIRSASQPKLERLREIGAEVSFMHVCGLSPGDGSAWPSHAFFLNVADSLAYRGRVRREPLWTYEDGGAGLPERLAAIDWCLDPRHDYVSRKGATLRQAAARIGVGLETVMELVANGHLRYLDADEGQLRQWDVDRIAKVYATMAAGSPAVELQQAA